MTAHEAVRAQRSAARPACSVWVSANAGSGKTRVLTERVARLLLDDAEPAKILCLTFTKAAAAEMQRRLFEMLGRWAMAEDRDLARALSELTGGAEFGPDELDKARRLFAQALETPGGLKIQTIHAFCDNLLRRFPLEAGAPPGFVVMEERDRQELIADVLNTMADDAANGGADAFAAIAADRNEGGVMAVAYAALARRDLFRDARSDDEIAAAFGVSAPPDADEERLAAISRLDMSRLRRMIAAWAAGSATEVKRAADLTRAEGESGEAFADALTAALLTKAGEPRKKLANKAAAAAEPDHEALCAYLVEIALAAREAEAAAHAAAAAIRLNRFGHRLVAGYEAAKARGALLDFDDLVGKARALLTRSEARDWVLYRLDGGVDHILVDEAQDTSSAQWDVIDAIAGEFRAGIGAKDGPRTSFVVGDEKQSIYRFQGAAPEMFDQMRGRFRDGLEPFGGQVEEELAFSFRSAPAILRAVDAAFQGDRAEGLNAAGAPPAHKAFHDGRAGRVELWPITEEDPSADPPQPWAPVDMPEPRSARLKLVDEVVARIKDMVDHGHLPGEGGRRISAGDIIVLLRARAPMMGPLVRGLKAAGVPVAGADRLHLTEELAVKDLLALLRFASTPADDLSLAALLRSPLFGASEEDLFGWAYGRKSTLWRSVREAAPEAVVGPLKRLLSRSGFARPYELMQMALTDWDGRRAFLRRLGEEAEDAIDELLAEALAFEALGPPTIEAFLARMDESDFEVKREQEGRGGAVRVMSVHGAKGLEAPVVILPDTLRKPNAARGWLIAEVDGEGRAVAAATGPRAEDPTALRAAREREEQAEQDEHRRLLYVAMTRAEDLLIVAGAGEETEAKLAGTWYEMVRDGLVAEGAAQTADGRLVLEDAGAGKAAGYVETAEIIAPVIDLETRHPARPRGKRIAASGLHGVGEARPGGLTPELAALRGEAIHAALELGADTPENARKAMARFALPDPVALAAAAEAVAARALPEAARFFAPEAVAEAGVSLDRAGTRIAGRLDRLVVSEDAVAFVDFKSDAAPPAPDAPPEAYLAQLGAYAEALAGIYPGRRVEAHILWTAVPSLDRLEPGAMAAALSRALAAS